MSDCLYCQLMQGKKIFEDNKLCAVLHPAPTAPGHILLFSKEHKPIFENIADFDIGQMFVVANKLSTAAFETLSSQGTNIIIQNGVAADQKIPHFAINIIPRRENDGLNLLWQPKQLNEEEMSTVELQLKEAAKNLGEIEKEPRKPINLDKPVLEIKPSKGQNYLIKQLLRIP
jgi:histidine triad (HIT) family protein